jgi:hypothetical protein
MEYVSVAILVIAIANFVYGLIKLNKVEAKEKEVLELFNVMNMTLVQQSLNIAETEQKLDELKIQIVGLTALIEKERDKKRELAEAYKKSTQAKKQRGVNETPLSPPSFLKDNPSFDLNRVNFDQVVSELKLTEEEISQLASVKEMFEQSKGG